MDQKFYTGQKVLIEYAYDWYRGKVISVNPLLVKTRPFNSVPRIVEGNMYRRVVPR